VAHVGPTGLRNGVVVDIDDSVEVVCDNLGDIVKFLEVVLAICNKRGESQRCKVANSCLFWGGVFHNLRAEVRGFDGSKILLVRLACDGLMRIFLNAWKEIDLRFA